jgi:DNA repair protein RecN (Recombination protein N)
VEDAAMTLAKYERSLEADPEQLDAIEQRKEELKSLVRKHGVPVDEVVTLGERIAGEIETLEAFEEAKQEAIGRVAECLKRAREHAVSLSRKRRQASKQLSKRVVSELEDLMFSKAGFDVRIESEPETLSRAGIDQVSFLVSLNPGEGAHPIQKVASGGELSRLMLAIKRAVAGMGPVGTYIFDEVDAGIGGPVASAVGRKLKEVSTCHQVICITHLAQIAGMADHHLFISKTEAEGRTTSAVVPLRKNDRIEELARMLAGDQVTAKTRAAAKELIAS